jgi:2-dehydro-3-deoxygluconokinase
VNAASRIVCFGELLLRLGAPGHERLLQSPALQVHVGGAEANVAVSLARFGHASALVGTVADNALGQAAIAELRRYGVDVGGLRRVKGRMGLYFLSPGAGHRPSEVLYDRADSAFARAGADAYDWPALLRGAQWLHVSGVTPAVGAQAAEAAIAAVEAARAAGVRVSFDGNFREKLWAAWNGSPAGILRRILASAELAFANHRDVDMVLGPAAPDEGEEWSAKFLAGAARAFDAFPQLQRIAAAQRTQHSVDHHSVSAILVTRAGNVSRAASRELSGIVDRIGTGDAFAAGVLHGLLTGMDDADALAFGHAAACLKHAQPGDFHLANAEEVGALAQGGGLDVRR